VYRCAECRGQPCAAGAHGKRSEGCAGVREGWLARRKVLHLFVAMARRFGALEPRVPLRAHTSDPAAPTLGAAKHAFLKLDPDTVPLPHHLLSLLGELRGTLGDGQPYYFGMAACRVASFPLCHASGGAGYGLSRAAVAQLAAYLTRQYPSFLERVDKFTYGGEDVAVAYALKKHAGAAVVNVGCLYQHGPRTYAKLHAKGERWVRWPLSSTPASFHKFKRGAELRAFFGCALYDARGQPRTAPRALFFAPPNRSDDEPPSTRAPCADAWWPSALSSPRVPVDGGLTRVVGG
jgi:hypothetical protein